VPAPDLSFARRLATELMTDTCIITTDPGVSDDIFDFETGTLTKGTPTVIYEGACMVNARSRPIGSRAGAIDYEGGAPATIQLPEVKIPFDAPEPPVGANVQVTDSQDAAAVGDRYVIRDVGFGTYAPWRVLACNRWVKGQLVDHS
jgi:hypothetical protein